MIQESSIQVYMAHPAVHPSHSPCARTAPHCASCHGVMAALSPFEYISSCCREGGRGGWGNDDDKMAVASSFVSASCCHHHLSVCASSAAAVRRGQETHWVGVTTMTRWHHHHCSSVHLIISSCYQEGAGTHWVRVTMTTRCGCCCRPLSPSCGSGLRC